MERLCRVLEQDDEIEEKKIEVKNEGGGLVRDDKKLEEKVEIRREGRIRENKKMKLKD